MVEAKKRLERADWIRGGLDRLHELGIGAVRVEPLAKALGVTKGSFYWHFKDLDTLHEAMVEDWMETQIAATQRIMQGEPDDAEASRRFLLDRFLRKDPRHDVAVRVWAQHDDRAAGAVARVDKARLSALQRLLADIGVPPDELDLRARTLFYAQIGDQLCQSRPSDSERVAYFASLEAMCLGKP